MWPLSWWPLALVSIVRLVIALPYVPPTKMDECDTAQS